MRQDFNGEFLPDSPRHGDYGHVCWEGCELWKPVCKACGKPGPCEEHPATWRAAGPVDVASARQLLDWITTDATNVGWDRMLAARGEKVLADKKKPLGAYAYQAGWYAAMEYVERLLNGEED